MARLLHRNVTVTDLDASVRFYQHGLGFAPEEESKLPGGYSPLLGTNHVDARVAHLQNGKGVALALTQFVAPSPVGSRERCRFDHFGYTHLAFYVDSMEAAAARLEAGGGTVLHHTHARYDAAGVEMLYGLDPDGVRIELMTGPGIPAAFSHSGLCVDSIAAALPFFEALGFAPEESFDFSEPLEWTAKITETPGLRQKVQMIRNAHRDTLELLEIIHPAPRSRGAMPQLHQFGFNGMSFSLEDADKTAERLQALGGLFPKELCITVAGNFVRHGATPWDTRLELIGPAH
ncbi:VOC family protein [Sphingobium aromaticivastans]|uniref:VOC family protein n=1 Tax=Sphingobium aromaticivastans TaxID=1778665 RepID=UPI00301A24F3